MRSITTMFLLMIAIFILPTISYASPNDRFVDEMFENDSSDVQQEENSEDTKETSDTTTQDTEITNANTTNPILLIFRIIVALVFILGLMYVLVKLFNKKNKVGRNSGAMKNLGGIPLGTNKSVQILQIADRLFIVGVGENIELLTEINDQATKDMLIKQVNTDFKTPNPIAKIIGDRFTKSSTKNKYQSNEASDSFADFFQSELTTLKKKRSNITDRYKRKEEDNNE